MLNGNDRIISLFYTENIPSRTETPDLALALALFVSSISPVFVDLSGWGKKWPFHHLPAHGSQKHLSPCFLYFAQERDAERRRQLRERARQLIAEARSGVKMSEMSLLDASGAERGKGGRTGPAAGQRTLLKTYKYTCRRIPV